ncbi:MAG: glyoxylate/hydroxypyruvate reductase A [Halocynthiibacter sp.]|jgi:glyoxylate/hydroxypyruvate reductase A
MARLQILFSAPDARWEDYRDALPKALKEAGIDASLARDLPADTVDYIVYAPNDGLSDFAPFTRTRAVLSLWAGVESIAPNKSLTQPLTRMVDAGLEEGMVEWVCGHSLRYHLGMDAQIVNPSHAWSPTPPPLARNRRVSILGLGALGQACAKALRGLNFDVAGWSRSARNIEGITCFHGADGLNDILKRSDILITLLPLTEATQNLLNHARFAQLPKGAFLLNPGRGALIDDAALLDALASGQIAHATLDTFRIEPLPRDHPFWAHPQITVTPHIASETRPETASQVIAENIRRCEAGEPLLFEVDRARGY